jgi:hypothetical protein
MQPGNFHENKSFKWEWHRVFTGITVLQFYVSNKSLLASDFVVHAPGSGVWWGSKFWIRVDSSAVANISEERAVSIFMAGDRHCFTEKLASTDESVRLQNVEVHNFYPRRNLKSHIVDNK